MGRFGVGCYSDRSSQEGSERQVLGIGQPIGCREELKRAVDQKQVSGLCLIRPRPGPDEHSNRVY